MLDIQPTHIYRLNFLARKAIEMYGETAQYNMVIEECSELLNEVAKIHRDRQNWDNILEEAVDTYIMMTEVFIMFGPEKVNAMMAKKLDKFAGNLERSEAKRAAKHAELVRRINAIPTDQAIELSAAIDIDIADKIETILVDRIRDGSVILEETTKPTYVVG